MTLRSGLAASAGFGDESAWGTPVTPTVWVPMVDEGIEADIQRLESEAQISGARVLRSQQWEAGMERVAGDVGFELNDISKGVLFKHMMGGTGTTGPFTPADLTGLGLTTQIGVPDVDAGTVRPKTMAGGKVLSWEMGLVAGEIATLGLDLVGRYIVGHRSVADGVTTNTDATITSATAAFISDDVGKPISGTGIPAGATIASVTSATEVELSAAATATGSSVTFTIGLALTSPSYTSGIAPMSFIGGSILVAGTALKVREITLAGDNGLADDRDFIGQRFIDEPLEQQLREYTGTIETEYWSDTHYRRFLAGSESALVLTIARGTKSVTVTTNVRYDGETPKVADRGVVGQTLPFKMIGTTTDASAISIALDES